MCLINVLVRNRQKQKYIVSVDFVLVIYVACCLHKLGLHRRPKFPIGFDWHLSNNARLIWKLDVADVAYALA